jgi:hypothetical protein
MFALGFERAVPERERSPTLALDRSRPLGSTNTVLVFVMKPTNKSFWEVTCNCLQFPFSANMFRALLGCYQEVLLNKNYKIKKYNITCILTPIMCTQI